MSRNETTTVVAFIGLGSNLEDPVGQIRSARQNISDLEGVEEIAFSSLYGSPPMGPQDQPDYVNAVMAIRTRLPAIELLESLQRIEDRHGRVRKQRWGARTLDLDILLYGDRQIAEKDLVVPHVGMAERAFVLYPLREVADCDLYVPGKGRLQDLIDHCPETGLHKLVPA